MKLPTAKFDPINLINLAKLMIEINGTGTYEIVPFPPDRQPIDIGDYYGDYRKLLGKLGWSPKVDLRAGMTKTIAYYNQYLEHYR